MNEKELLNRIVVDPKIMVGKPIIKGTRLTVQYILGLLAQGMTTQEILQEYKFNKRRYSCVSQQEYLWGINMYPHMVGTENWIEFDSMINLRPAFPNRSRYVEDPKIREKITSIVNKLVVQK